MKRVNVFGIVLSMIIGIGFIGAFFGWLQLVSINSDVKKQQYNEVCTYLNLKKIVKAQAIYKQHDWDNDGELEYSPFLVHLWKTIINKNGEALKINLISKKLGFATEPSFAQNGYVFKMLYEYHADALELMDYKKEWAICAFPLDKGTTGLLTFIVDHRDTILVSATQNIYKHEYPDRPLDNSWKIISKKEDLIAYQGGLRNKVTQSSTGLAE